MANRYFGKNADNRQADTLVTSYSYANTIVSDAAAFKKKIEEKSLIPYQVEFQPPPSSKRAICWLECPYCYGKSADDSESPRMNEKMALDVLDQIADGGVSKVIFAGYATDPLNCSYIDALLQKAIEREMVFGFNTKGLRCSKKFLELLGGSNLKKTSYISFSVDAGSNETYDRMHGIKNKTRLYDRVLENVKRCRVANSRLDISATYLVNQTNDGKDDIVKFIEDYKSAGCNLIRFSFLQPPRGEVLSDLIIPDSSFKESIITGLQEIARDYSDETCIVQVSDVDAKNGLNGKLRSLPCFARFIFPTVGYDGWLYNCSQSSAPNFHGTALGDLSQAKFWDLYYDYDASDFKKYFEECSRKLNESGCRCDRKMHLANINLQKSGLFQY